MTIPQNDKQGVVLGLTLAVLSHASATLLSSGAGASLRVSMTRIAALLLIFGNRHRMDQQPKETETPPPARRHPAALYMLAGLAFLLLAVGVFVLAETQARKTDHGFPTFAESQFELVDQQGNVRTNADFEGRPIAVFFGFTYCPDVCPTTLLSLAGAVDDLAETGIDASDLQILFITVDHERDTPAQINDYLTLFEVPVTGLTGSKAAIESAVAAFGAFAERVETDGGDFTYDHSAAVYLYRADGRFKGTIVFNEPAEFIREKIKSLVS